MKSGIANKVIYKRIFLTKTSLCLIMTEMRDAVAFMCIFRHFKRVDPATTIAGVQSQPFSFTVAHAIRNDQKRGALAFHSLQSFWKEKFSISSDPLLRNKNWFFLEHKSLHSLHKASKVFLIKQFFSEGQRNAASAICL